MRLGGMTEEKNTFYFLDEKKKPKSDYKGAFSAQEA